MNETETMAQVEDKLVARWRKEDRRERWGRIARWVIGVPLILFSYPWLSIIGPFCVVAGCVLIVPDIAEYLSNSLANIIWPRREGAPKPMYGIPESLVAQGKYVEAEREYLKIINTAIP